ncbi:MAG: orotidine-5'-phosphate decarboxylase [Bdellovibrionales bacterium]|nr:orotidine-5'-phosphate decarboxylase [Bdellovibrionales bacterium]
MRNKLIVALDFPTGGEAKSFLSEIGNDVEWVKVGMELFYSEGKEIVTFLKNKNYKVFLDLKLHDIPNTVARATNNLLKLSVDMINFHAAGGSQMLKAVSELSHKDTLLIGVTQLTSTSENQMKNEQLIPTSLEDSVLHYTGLCLDSGLNGVVCSPLEVKAIKEKYAKCITVCPGVRLNVSETQDQVRVTSPSAAIQSGADFIVMGREITKAKDPKKMISDIYSNMKG